MTEKPQNETNNVSIVKKEFQLADEIYKDYSDKLRKFIIDTLAPTLDQNELRLFLYRSHKLGLNPLEGEIFAYSSHEMVGGQKSRKMVMIVARDGKRRIAARTGHLKAIKSEAIYIKDTEKQYTHEHKDGDTETKSTKITERVQPWEGGTLWGATCTIKRDDYDEPFEATVKLSEYNTGRSVWFKKPETMIKKVAESQCLSLAFPELGGVYDESERFDNDTPAKLNAVEGGDQPATNEQIRTIEALGGNTHLGMTKQEAAQAIKDLSMSTK